MLELTKYVRQPFEVDTVRVTADNMMSVALWCGGEIRSNVKGDSYIKVWVPRPANERQTMAFIGDWVLYAGTGYKVYSHRAFSGTFSQKPAEEACGLVDFTSDHKPCVLGKGHRAVTGRVGCRSLQDYMLVITVQPVEPPPLDWETAQMEQGADPLPSF